MANLKEITPTVKYVGVNDYDIDLFEGQFDVPKGMCYNSYLILGDKTAVMDSVDGHFTEEWIGNIKEALGGKEPDYLVVQHMEPDHSGSIADFMEAFPKATVVSSAKAFPMMKAFFGTDFAGRSKTVAEGDTLELGGHTLSFIGAPMVHWPEVIMTYDKEDKLLFSADGFGKFGAMDADEEWIDEARRYYIGIVAKFGAQVQAVLKKAAGLDIAKICPLHGPVLCENLGYYIDLYSKWSSFAVEEPGILIAYTSVYGNTRHAVETLAEKLEKGGCPKVAVYDLARDDMAAAVADAFRFDKVVLATTTYNGDIFPAMKDYINHLLDRAFQGRTVAFIENGAWGPVAAKKMLGMLEGCKNLAFAENIVTVKGALNAESEAKLDALVTELLK